MGSICITDNGKHNAPKYCQLFSTFTNILSNFKIFQIYLLFGNLKKMILLKLSLPIPKDVKLKHFLLFILYQK